EQEALERALSRQELDSQLSRVGDYGLQLGCCGHAVGCQPLDDVGGPPALRHDDAHHPGSPARDEAFGYGSRAHGRRQVVESLADGAVQVLEPQVGTEDGSRAHEARALQLLGHPGATPARQDLELDRGGRGAGRRQQVRDSQDGCHGDEQHAQQDGYQPRTPTRPAGWLRSRGAWDDVCVRTYVNGCAARGDTTGPPYDRRGIWLRVCARLDVIGHARGSSLVLARYDSRMRTAAASSSKPLTWRLPRGSGPVPIWR